MSFTLQCLNKECRKLTEPLLDLETNDVVCSDCGAVIPNITDFVKRQLKFEKKIKSASKKGASFGLKCGSCDNNDTPVFKKNALWCSKCDSKLNATPQFIQIFKMKVNQAI